MKIDKPESLITSQAASPARRKRIFGLGAKFTLLLLGGFIFLTAITTWFSVKYLRASVSLGLTEMAAALGRVVKVASAYKGFFDEDTRQLNQYIDSAASQPDVAYAAILDKKGKVLAQRGLSAKEVQFLEKGECPFPAGEIFQETQDITMDSPIGKLGTIVIGISKSRINREETRIITTQILTAAIIAFLSLAILWGVVISITRPLRKLMEQTRQIGEGELGRPVKVKARDEVGELADSIEQMRVGLHRNLAKMAFLGQVAHDLNSALTLKEAINKVRLNLKNYLFFPVYEVGLDLVGRGIPPSSFHHYAILPPPSSDEKEFITYPLENTVIGKAIASQTAINRNFVRPVGSGDFAFYLKEKEIKADLVVPLVIKESVLGALYAGFKEVPAQLSELQVVMQNIADDLAAVIEGIYLIEDLRFNLQQLKRAHQELKSLDNLKTEFISGVSHELKTPLVSITGYMHMMLEEKLGKITDLQKEGLETSVKSLKRLTNLIEKMLTFSSEQKEEELIMTDFEIGPLIEHCLAMVKSAAESRNVELRFNVEKNLPRVRANEDRIIQILINLMDNAIKFSREGGKVEVKARLPFIQAPETEGKIEVLVRDRGRGISQKDLPRVFEKFWQSGPEEGYKYSGIGLGLSLVKKILEQHGCGIEVESQLGKGSTFVFTLPVASRTARG